MSGNYSLSYLLCSFSLEDFPMLQLLTLRIVPTECLFWSMKDVKEKLQLLSFLFSVRLKQLYLTRKFNHIVNPYNAHS